MQQVRSQLRSLVFLASVLWQHCRARLFARQIVLKAMIPAMLIMMVIVSLHTPGPLGTGPFPWP
ncbi:MAG: hypothetical protein WCD86_05530 [Ktedonobacteraceae bacterium]|nr:hypothetical protein [Ktedonobacteraceae bacterium]